MTNLPDYDSPSFLKDFLEKHDMAMQKKFGQNFLINGRARNHIADALEIVPGTTVWEVGPGLGAMTTPILSRGAKLTAFEIDRGFCSLLPDFFKDDNFKLVQGDVLKTWKKEFQENGQPSRFFGNLPYNIAAAIIADMISENVRFDIGVVTVQKEVAVRMAAKPGSEDYSSFSVLCQWAYDISTVIDLTGSSFWPKPNVDSRAVKMIKKENFPGCKSPRLFMQIQRALFSSRRKTVKNNLSVFFQNTDKALSVLEAAGIDPSIRAERLALKDFLNLADAAYDETEIKDA